jgi:hypothetical protein
VLIALTIGSCSLIQTTAAPPQATQAKTTQAAAPTSAAAQGSWSAVIGLISPGVAAIGKTSMTSSSKLEVQWNLPNQPVDHFEIIASDGKSKVTANAKGTEKTATLTALKSSTKYSVSMKACLDAKCEKFLASDKAAEGKTSEEVWQVQGKGTSYETATKLVDDGNTKPYVVVYGDWAGKDLAGKLQLYYDPINGSEKGVKIATMTAAKIDGLSSIMPLKGLSGFGLVSYCRPQPGQPQGTQPRPPQPSTPPQPAQPPQPQKLSCEGTSAAARVATFQAIPLSEKLGSRVRLFFEGEGTDGKTRVMFIDSKDGYVGRDFNSGSSTVCSTSADYSKGGGCEPTVIVGVEGDATFGNKNIKAVRQFKIGYPTMNDWRWDGASGSFMFITIDVPQTCSKYMMTSGYAVWDGKEWKVQYSSNGCPKLFEAVQAPMPMHIGGTRYKMYFNNNAMQPGGGAGGGVPAATSLDDKPMKVIYADASLTGDPNVVDYEDWETIEQAHDITYLWSDGSVLAVKDESHLDDYAIFAPTRSLDFQVVYSNMSLSDIKPGTNFTPPFIGVVLLINP